MPRDLRQSFRIFLQNPGFTIAALVAIAVGIGANTAVFSVVNAILLKPLPYPDADRIVQFQTTYAGVISGSIVGPSAFSSLREQTTLFQDISAHWLDHMNLTGGSNAELLSTALVTADFFRLYGAPVIRGRTFTSVVRLKW